MTDTTGFEGRLKQLFTRLEEENPNASLDELKVLMFDGIRRDPALVNEAVDWFVHHRNYPAKDS